MVLSAAVLRRIAAALDQETRVACCVATARLREALEHPSAWRRTVVYAPNSHALRFVCRVRPEVLHLPGAEVRHAEWFLDQLVAEGAHVGLQELHVTFAPVCALAAPALLPTVADFPGLRQLTLEFESVSRSGCLVFPGECGGLRALEYLRITERPVRPGTSRTLEVYFADARLPQLREVHLQVATSDVLAHVPRFPQLRVVRYGAERENFEDADLEGAKLDLLHADVRDTTAMHYLTVALERAAYIDRVQLACFADMFFDASVAAAHLSVQLHPPASQLDVVHSVVRRLASVSVDGGPGQRRFTVKFVGAGSWHNFFAWTQRAQLHVGMDGVLVVDPL